MLCILADDLTGALDSAAPFADRGLRTEVALTPEGQTSALAERPDVLSVDLACREKTEQETRSVAADAIRALPAGTRLLIKIDSRLKGHVPALLDVVPFAQALVAPAIPEFNRVVRNGAVCGFGVDTPINIATSLGRHAVKCLIPDTVSQADMDEAVAQGDQAGVDLLVGARGLAEALAKTWSGRQQRAAAEIPAGRALFVIGSRDPITLQQIDHLTQAADIDDRRAENGCLTNIAKIADRVTLVRVVEGQGTCSAEEVSRRLADGVVPRLTDQVETLLLCGGATAEAVLHRMGIHRLRLLGECLPGLGLAQSGRHCIIAKSGGFGQPNTLTDIATTILGKTD